MCRKSCLSLQQYISTFLSSMYCTVTLAGSLQFYKGAVRFQVEFGTILGNLQHSHNQGCAEQVIKLQKIYWLLGLSSSHYLNILNMVFWYKPKFKYGNDWYWSQSLSKAYSNRSMIWEEVKNWCFGYYQGDSTKNWRTKWKTISANWHIEWHHKVN